MGASYRPGFPAAGCAAWPASARRVYRGGGASGPSYDATALAYFTAAGVTTEPYLSAINTFIVDGKASGWWDKMDRIWLLANEDATAALMCLKSLSVATAVNTPTFTAGQGYTFNGSSNYINTGFDRTTGGQVYAQNSANFGMYIRSTVSETSNVDPIGTVNGTSLATMECGFPTGADFYSNVNNADALGLNAATSGRVGLWQFSRTGSAAVEAFKNGASLDTGTMTSTTLTSGAFFIGARREAAGTPGRLWAGQASMAFMGDGFNSTQAAAFDTAVDTLKAAIGF